MARLIFSMVELFNSSSVITTSSIFAIVLSSEPIGRRGEFDILPGQSVTKSPPGPNLQTGKFSSFNLLFISIFEFLFFSKNLIGKEGLFTLTKTEQNL